MSGGGAGISNGTRSRLNKSERQCEKEAERERAHNKMHDPAPISPANDIRVDLGFFSETESSPCRNLAPRSRANHACFWPQLSANTWTLLGDNVKYAGRNWTR